MYVDLGFKIHHCDSFEDTQSANFLDNTHKI